MHDSQAEPVSGFSLFNFSAGIQKGIRAAGFLQPRPIQAQAIPAALEGRDILGLAQTGTGKTAAFALPLLQRLQAGTVGSHPRVLVVAPTRELAVQISEEMRTLARFTGVKVTAVFGGVSINKQITALRAAPEIVVACPGRLLDLMQRGAVKLHRIESVVLDEADHMFDMGFLPDVRRILGALPSPRQTLLFSATMPAEIRKLAHQTLRSPHVVEMNHTRPLTTIEHALYPTAEPGKQALLEHVLAGDDFVSAIVFTRTKHRAKRLAQKLERSGHKAVALQGNMSQAARVRAMNGFRRRQVDVLVATDIAARGLDVEQVSHVVNFDMPNTSEAYTHRIGRTGRAEREGKAYTFVTADDHGMVREVERRLGSTIPRRHVEGVAGSASDAPRSGGGEATGPGRQRPGNRRRAAAGNGRPEGGGRSRSRRSRNRKSNASQPATPRAERRRSGSAGGRNLRRAS